MSRYHGPRDGLESIPEDPKTIGQKMAEEEAQETGTIPNYIVLRPVAIECPYCQELVPNVHITNPDGPGWECLEDFHKSDCIYITTRGFNRFGLPEMN